MRHEKIDHHIRGAEEAEEILKSFNYPEEKIAMVTHCILTHSSDQNYPPESKEAKVVASADALSHFDNMIALVYGRTKAGRSIPQIKEFLKKKYEIAWSKLVFEAQEITRPKYDSILMVIGD